MTSTLYCPAWRSDRTLLNSELFCRRKYLPLIFGKSLPKASAMPAAAGSLSCV